MRALACLITALLAVPAMAGTAADLDRRTLSLSAGAHCLDQGTTFASELELGDFVIANLVAGDRAALRKLAVGEREFRDVIWPQLPVSRPELNFDQEFVWQSHSVRNESAFQNLIGRFEGRYLELVDVDVEQVDDYGNFRILKRPRVHLRDARGDQHTVRLFGSIVEQDGRYKLYSFRTD